MALDPKSKKDIDEARLFIQDTLLSVGAKISESIKDSIEQAVDGVDASAFEEVFTKQKMTGIQSLQMPAWGYQVFVKKNVVK